MKMGMIIIREITAMIEPISVSFIASWPLPCIRNLCPGKTPRAVSSFGAPRNVDGMKSMNVWVIAMAEMKITASVVFWIAIRNGRRIIAIRLMWIPGIRPVMVPAKIPRNMAKIKLNIYLKSWNFIMTYLENGITFLSC